MKQKIHHKTKSSQAISHYCDLHKKPPDLDHTLISNKKIIKKTPTESNTRYLSYSKKSQYIPKQASKQINLYQVILPLSTSREILLDDPH